MKRQLCITLLIGMFTLAGAQAQVRLGARVGAAYSSLVFEADDRPEAGSRFGYSAAFIADIPFWKEFSLRPELAIVSQGGSYYDYINPYVLPYKERYHYYSLQLPVYLCYTFSVSEIGVNLYGGPVADLPLFGKLTYRGEEEDLRFGSDKGDHLKPFGMGFGVGLGAEYRHFTFSINAVCGMTNRRVKPTSDASSVYQNNVTLALGYYFFSR